MCRELLCPVPQQWLQVVKTITSNPPTTRGSSTTPLPRNSQRERTRRKVASKNTNTCGTMPQQQPQKIATIVVRVGLTRRSSRERIEHQIANITSKIEGHFIVKRLPGVDHQCLRLEEQRVRGDEDAKGEAAGSGQSTKGPVRVMWGSPTERNGVGYSYASNRLHGHFSHQSRLQRSSRSLGGVLV